MAHPRSSSCVLVRWCSLLAAVLSTVCAFGTAAPFDRLIETTSREGGERREAAAENDDGSRALRELASHPVSRHTAQWSSAPKLVPGGGKTGAAQQPDGPIAGNGDFGVSIGGGRECCGGACCTADGGPGIGSAVASQPGAASLVNADLMLFFGKNDFWYNGYYRPHPTHAVPQTSSYYYSHGTPGFVTIQVGAATDGSDAEIDQSLMMPERSAAPGCPTGAGPPQPGGKCSPPCPDAPATGGWTKFPHTCPNDPSSCPPNAKVCGCARSQLAHGHCTSKEECMSAALGACEQDRRCFSFGMACSCNVTNPQPQSDMMWETYPIGSGQVVRNPTWTSYTKVAPPPPPPPPPAPPPPPPPPQIHPFAICRLNTCVGRTTGASNATSILVKSFLGMPAEDWADVPPPGANNGFLTPPWSREQTDHYSNFLWIWKNDQLHSVCETSACSAAPCMGSLASGEIGMVPCGSAQALNISLATVSIRGRGLKVTHANGSYGCLVFDRCQNSISTRLTYMPGCNDPAVFEKCGHLSMILGFDQYFAQTAPQRAMPRFSASQELARARLNVSSGVVVNGAAADLVSSTFVAKSTNLAVTKLQVEASQSATAQITVGTSNWWNMPTLSGVADGQRSWLFKESTLSVDNPLTLTPCNPSFGATTTQVARHWNVAADGVVKLSNGTYSSCISAQPPTNPRPAAAASLSMNDSWATQASCSSQQSWKFSGGRLTDGTNCLFYANGEQSDSVKVVVLPCTSTALNSSWIATASGMLQAAEYPGTAESSTARCLTANPPNVNVSVAMAAVLVDTQTNKAVEPNVALSCVNTTTCSMTVTLQPRHPYYLLVSCVTARDSPTPITTALAMLVGVDVPALEHEKDIWWAKFWQRSAVNLYETPIVDEEARGTLPFEPLPLEGFYYGMVYMSGGTYAPGKVATSHYGVYNTHDAPQCNGQMTLDYNTVACMFGMLSGNRLELAKPLVDTLGRDDVWAYGRARARANWTAPAQDGQLITDTAVFQCGQGSYGTKGSCPKSYGGFEGIEFSCAMGPFAPQSGNDYDCSLRSSAGMSTSMLVDWQDFTHGFNVSSTDGSLNPQQQTNYLNHTLLKFLAGVADFYSSYGVKNSSGTTNLPDTCAQEMCQLRTAGGHMSSESNNNADLGYARMAVAKLKQYHEEDLIPAFRPQWTELEASLAPYPTVHRTGFGEGFAEAVGPGGSQPPNLGNSDYPVTTFGAIHPAGVIGHESPPDLLQIARSTVWAVNTDNQWHPANGFCLAWPPAGRIVSRDDGQRLLDAASIAVRTVCFPNYWPNLGGGGLENGGAVEAIHSMLLQSHESCLRLFPGWPVNGSASFTSLRARGGFVLSAKQTAGVVGSVNLTSELGGNLSFCLPHGWGGVNATCGGESVQPTLTDAALRRYRVATAAGERCTLAPA